MSLFSTKSSSSIRYGAVIEIGSGSVLVSIVQSDQAAKHPDIIWSKREYSPRQKEATALTSAKGVMTALVNAVMLVESEGVPSLHTKNPHAKLTTTQVSITAPWSYTISKVINYTEEKPFTVTSALLNKLQIAAEEKVTEELKENELATELGLTIMTRATTDIQANDYKTENPIGKEVMTLTLTQVSAVAQIYLTNAITELHQKMLGKTTLERYSFMLMFHCIIRELHHNATEYCLVDVTFEATEIGIVRDGILRYCTHTTMGISSLAREIAKVLVIPLPEAYAFLKEPYHTHAMSELPQKKQLAVTEVFADYQTTITKLFHETGDALSIPKILFLHSGEQTEAFFAHYITQAAKGATNSQHTVYPVTEELLTASYTAEEKQVIDAAVTDTALLVAAQFFHKQHHCNDFIQV